MKREKGITLISLVITIVVLIILAGVAVNMTIGENGIFTKAQEAKKAQEIGAAKEQIGLEILEAQIEKMENNEELEQAEVEEIVAKYGVLQADGDTIILNDSGYEVSLSDIYNTMVEVEGDTTTELAQLKALLAQTTVTEDKILKNYKAYKDGQLIIGTMENYAGKTQDATATSDDTYTYISIPNDGYYTTDSKLRMGNSDLANNSYILYASGYSYANTSTCTVLDYNSDLCTVADNVVTISKTGTLRMISTIYHDTGTYRGIDIYKNGTLIKFVNTSTADSYTKISDSLGVLVYDFDVTADDEIYFVSRSNSGGGNQNGLSVYMK